MTAAIVRLDDLDTPLSCPALTALDGLAALHALPSFVKAYPSPTGMHLALTPATAEQWRAAVAAPPYTRTENEHYSTYRTEAFWFGITLRLTYADY